MAPRISLQKLGFLSSLALIACLLQVVEGTERPIIGILAHEIDNKPPDSYIAASYVKAVEASGARVVPILLSRDEQYYVKLIDSLNGIVLPGGDALATTAGGYFEAARYIFDYSRKLHAQGDHFPLLGVCLGMEALAVLSNEDHFNNETLDGCSGLQGIDLPLVFRADFRDSSLYKDLPANVEEILRTQNVTANYHSWCVRPDKNLTLPWHFLSENIDGDGKGFISSMELEGPIAGIQFHPEKNAFEWQQKHASFEDGLIAARHFYDWLVIEARKNNHSFKDSKEEDAYLIYNYIPEFIGANGGYFTQQYNFKEGTSGVGSLLSSTLLLVAGPLLTIITKNYLN